MSYCSAVCYHDLCHIYKAVVYSKAFIYIELNRGTAVLLAVSLSEMVTKLILSVPDTELVFVVSGSCFP